MTRRFILTFDYLCPFARNANEHVTAALRAGADWDVRFLPYSLAQGHTEEDETPVWEREDVLATSGVLALAAGVVVRDAEPQRFLDTHDALFAARHDQGNDLKDPEVVRSALRSAGVDADAVLAEVSDGAALKTLRTEHELGVEEHQVWGVPTFITEARGVFVRLMDRPNGDAQHSLARIDQVLELVDGPLALHEFKQVDLPR